MFIYHPLPVNVQPNMIIGYWAVYRCDNDSTDHFAGIQIDNGYDMVSSAIQSFDPVARVAAFAATRQQGRTWLRFRLAGR